MNNKWDWNKALPSDYFNWVAVRGYAGWDRIDNSDPKYPVVPFVLVRVVRFITKSSRSMAVEFDDIATGVFYYRDWTSSGLLFVENREVYFAGFWFSRKNDAEKFVELYGGVGNWQEGFQQVQDQLKVELGR